MERVVDNRISLGSVYRLNRGVNKVYFREEGTRKPWKLIDNTENSALNWLPWGAIEYRNHEVMSLKVKKDEIFLEISEKPIDK